MPRSEMSSSNEISRGVGETIEDWGRTHTGLIGLLGLLVAIGTVLGVVLGGLEEAWGWVYDREWATGAVMATLALALLAVTLRSARLRRNARQLVASLEGELGPYRETAQAAAAVDPVEQQRLLDVELKALKRQAQQTGLVVAWEESWRYRIRKAGGGQRNLVTIALNKPAIEARQELRAALRAAEPQLRKAGMRVSPDLLRDP